MTVTLWKGQVRTESEIVVQDTGLRSWRRHLEWDAVWEPENKGFGLASLIYWRCDKYPKWSVGFIPWNISLNVIHWRWGYDCFYYDGTHHTYSVGPFHLYWGDSEPCSCEDE